MSTYSNQVLIDKLQKLNSTQQSIQIWLTYHRRWYKQSVDVWYHELLKAPRQRKLAFLYLANDVMQNSRKKGSEFIDAWSHNIKAAMRHVYQECPDDSVRASVLRLLKIWRERSVFSTSLLNEIENDLHALQPTRADTAKDRASTTDAQPDNALRTAAAEPKWPVTKLLLVLEELVTRNESLAQQIAAIPPALLTGELIERAILQSEVNRVSDEIREVYARLEQYCAALESELEQRAALIVLLQDTLAQQRLAVEQTTATLTDVISKRSYADAVLKLAEERKKRWTSLTTPSLATADVAEPSGKFLEEYNEEPIVADPAFAPENIVIAGIGDDVDTPSTATAHPTREETLKRPHATASPKTPPRTPPLSLGGVDASAVNGESTGEPPAKRRRTTPGDTDTAEVANTAVQGMQATAGSQALQLDERVRMLTTLSTAFMPGSVPVPVAMPNLGIGYAGLAGGIPAFATTGTAAWGINPTALTTYVPQQGASGAIAGVPPSSQNANPSGS